MGTPTNRRDFLRLSLGAAGATFSLPAILAACATAAQRSMQAPAGGGVHMAGASAKNPVTLPLYDDNPPIPSGLPLEDGATLRVYQFKEYLAPNVLETFERRYKQHGISVETTSFETIDEALGVITQPGSDFDVFFPSLGALGPLVREKMLRPINHEYLPNCENLWPQFTGENQPYFDVGMRYATPYTVFTSGLGWRQDMIQKGHDPAGMDDPYTALWDPVYRDKVGIYDNFREALGMAMVRKGVRDIAQPRPEDLAAAVESLLALDEAVGLRLEGEGTYEGLTEGLDAVRQSWSGDAISGRRYMLDEGGHEARDAEHLRYAWTPGGIVGVDLTTVLTQAKHPVAAHAFLNHLLDERVAMENFAWNGYQPATTSAVPKNFMPGGRYEHITGPGLASTIVSPEQWEQGILLLELDPEQETRWRTAWDEVVAVADYLHIEEEHHEEG